MTNLLEVRDLHVEFRLHQQGVVPAVSGVSFRIKPGSTVALVGESGSGKSVISQSIMGILPGAADITSGQIVFNDPAGQSVDIAALDPDDQQMRSIRGGRISMIFQEPMTSLSPLHTIGNQIEEAVRLHQDVNGEQAQEKAREMLAKVGFPDPDRALKTYPFELSGGLRQRAMIAMALVCRPALLIADEPTTALDVTIQAQTLKLMQDLQQEFGMAVLLITHDLGVVANMADEVVVVYHGRLMERGTLEQIFTNPRHPYLRALMKAVPRVGMESGEKLTPIRAVEPVHDSHLMQRDPWPEGAESAGPLLDVRNISKRFQIRKSGLFGGAGEAIQALDDVSLSIARGECLGLVGESGCGKTTLSKIIMRAVTADVGEIYYNDRGERLALHHMSTARMEALRQKIQFVFQDPFSSLNPRMTVFDIISEPLVIHEVGDRAHRIDIVKELMRHVGLDPRFLARYPHSFSGGQRQRIGIARALALNPELLICDEPVSALDVSVQAQILNLLKDLQAELGLTYLFVSHNLAVVDYMADRIAVMCRGHMVETARRDQIFANPVHPYTQALLHAVPRTDLDAQLDLTALMEGKASNPAEWPAPFAATGGARPTLLDIGDGHWVRAQPELTAEAAQ
ncbi:MAG: ABC transporter ATP-binding protein [Pseudomonadota bacterium]